MPGEKSKPRLIKIKGYEFQIEKDIEIPSKPGGAGSKAATDAMSHNRGKSDRSRTHNEGGTFEIYCNVKLRANNYSRNGIYFIIEA